MGKGKHSVSPCPPIEIYLHSAPRREIWKNLVFPWPQWTTAPWVWLLGTTPSTPSSRHTRPFYKIFFWLCWCDSPSKKDALPKQHSSFTSSLTFVVLRLKVAFETPFSLLIQNTNAWPINFFFRGSWDQMQTSSKPLKNPWALTQLFSAGISWTSPPSDHLFPIRQAFCKLELQNLIVAYLHCRS